MLDAPAEASPDTAAFDALDRTLKDSGSGATIDELIRRLDRSGSYRALLDALLLKSRFELGLPLVQVGSLIELPEPKRKEYEERYVEAIRLVGERFITSGDIPAAWPYFRAIGESEPVARAIDAYEPTEGDERLGAIIEIALNQGANPRKGFALILEHYGTCSAITAFEHLPADEATRVACADRLVRQLHEHLGANLRAEVAYRGEPEPPVSTSITDLIAGRDWLFADDAYHIDVSHLAATVRVSPLLSDPATIALAVELTDYGRRLSERHRYDGDPPFERTYEDQALYLRALLGQNVDAAITHLKTKLSCTQYEPQEVWMTAQVLVGLLLRLDRLDEAIDIAAEHLAGVPEAALVCPSVAQLCQRAGQSKRLARIARDQNDLVNYAAAILQSGPAGG